MHQDFLDIFSLPDDGIDGPHYFDGACHVPVASESGPSTTLTPSAPTITVHSTFSYTTPLAQSPTAPALLPIINTLPAPVFLFSASQLSNKYNFPGLV